MPQSSSYICLFAELSVDLNKNNYKWGPGPLIFSALGALLRESQGPADPRLVLSAPPPGGRGLPARGCFLEKPAQASAALAFPRRAIVRALGDRAAGQGSVSGTRGRAAWQGVPAEEALDSPSGTFASGPARCPAGRR